MSEKLQNHHLIFGTKSGYKVVDKRTLQVLDHIADDPQEIAEAKAAGLGKGDFLKPKFKTFSKTPTFESKSENKKIEDLQELLDHIQKSRSIEQRENEDNLVKAMALQDINDKLQDDLAAAYNQFENLNNQVFETATKAVSIKQENDLLKQENEELKALIETLDPTSVEEISEAENTENTENKEVK